MTEKQFDDFAKHVVRHLQDFEGARNTALRSLKEKIVENSTAFATYFGNEFKKDATAYIEKSIVTNTAKVNTDLIPIKEKCNAPSKFWSSLINDINQTSELLREALVKVETTIETEFKKQYGEGAEEVYSKHLRAAIEESFHRLYLLPKIPLEHPDLADIGEWKTIKTTMRRNNLIVND